MIDSIATFDLPVSGVRVALRHPTGAEDLLIAEAGASDLSLALALAVRLSCTADGKPIPWDAMAVGDLDAFVVRLRQALIGDRVVTDVACRDEACSARIDVSFRLEAYLAHHRPVVRMRGSRRRTVRANAESPGWFELVEGSLAGQRQRVRFRLPSVGDVIACAQEPNVVDALWRRCTELYDAPTQRRRVEAAMEALAPALSGTLRGVCPECATPIDAYFDARSYCLSELRDRASFIFEDVDLLAQRYGWTERAILAMPSARRASYLETIRYGATA